MKGDFSRSTFDPRRHYTTVRMQQGRVQLDADWNEQVDILIHLLRGQALDFLGPYGAPAGSAGFAIAEAMQGDTLEDLHIAAGRYYVDGILVENDDDALFSAQPYAPSVTLNEALQNGDRFVVYLDVWERHLTGAEIPSILEPALGGLDTTIRSQTVWQVRLWADSARASGDPPDNDMELLKAWEAWRDQTIAPARPTDGVVLRPRVSPKGFGLTNQLYRVEVHGTGDHATFKWSRDNGSRVVVVTSLEVKDDLLLAGVAGVPAETPLRSGDWMELVDPVFELGPRPAPLFKVRDWLAGDPASTTVTLVPGGALSESAVKNIQAIAQRLTQGGPPSADWPRPVLRRWDYNDYARGIAPGPDGAILVQPGQWLALENGIDIQFEGTGTLNPGDYWLIPARSEADGYELLWPAEHPPAPTAAGGESGDSPGNDAASRSRAGYAALPARRIDHHYAPLALLTRDGPEPRVRDVRTLYRALTAFEAGTESSERQLHLSVDELRAKVESEAAAAGAAVRALREEMLREVAHTPSVVYPVSDPGLDLEPGLVVAIDPATGGIQPATRANASLVVGVAIGPAGEPEEPGESPRRYRVAQTGRHECLVLGRVDAGDLLVPAHTPGHAMAAGLYIQPGTVIGKALQSYDPPDAQHPARVAILVTLR